MISVNKSGLTLILQNGRCSYTEGHSKAKLDLKDNHMHDTEEIP